MTEETMNQRIMYEKAKMDELEGLNRFKKLEEQKSTLGRELELCEHSEMISKFELAELQKIHDELIAEVLSVQSQNDSLVIPVLNEYKDKVCLSLMLYNPFLNNLHRFMNCLVK